MSHLPVIDLIRQRLPNTLAVVGVAYVIGLLLAIPIGVISAVRRYSLFDHLATTFAFIGFSLPTFFTGLLLIIIFSVKLRWLPFVYNSTLKVTNLASLGDQIKQSIMPITVLALFHAATLTRTSRVRCSSTSARLRAHRASQGPRRAHRRDPSRRCGTA